MTTIEDAFGSTEVRGYAVNLLESLDVVADYIGDTGIRSPVLLDAPPTGDTCHQIPPDAPTLTEHFQLRVGAANDLPFPLHVVIAPDGTIAYATRDLNPDTLLDVIGALVAE